MEVPLCIHTPGYRPTLHNTVLSSHSHVRAASDRLPIKEGQTENDIQGHPVLTAYAPVLATGWLLFVEIPVAEAYAPLYASILRSGALILAALGLAALAGIFLARRMVVPIQALGDGAARIGSGDL